MLTFLTRSIVPLCLRCGQRGQPEGPATSERARAAQEFDDQGGWSDKADGTHSRAHESAFCQLRLCEKSSAQILNRVRLLPGCLLFSD